ncbi:MAG TPA: T9SS type A sorting domain-containing protein [Melioribacteraceae bacterium]|nr:T9SS type A sorting domain-containing protein [Melioribacteraceae bacterium]
MKNLLLVFLFAAYLINGQTEQNELISGFRASRILSSYPNNQFPNPLYWASAGEFISSKFQNSNSAAIWIVSLYIDGGYTQLNFPNPGGSYPYVYFINSDYNETYLNLFDQKGIKVYLQVEPGAAKIDTLIHIVLNKYKHHPCVVGFGIDVEWYNTHLLSGGQKVTDIEARRWENKVKSIDSNYTLFLKHYGQAWMPPTYRGNILFVDDSQDFVSLNSMVSEFKAWGNKFKPNKVAFQYGYPIDKHWWSKLNDPIKTIGNSLLSNISNCAGLFWVDFTINDVYPVTNVISEHSENNLNFEVSNNYPNPFNPKTNFMVYIPQNGNLLCQVFDINGREIEEIYNGNVYPGKYQFHFNGEKLSSGIYLLKISFTDLENKLYIKLNKMSLIK